MGVDEGDALPRQAIEVRGLADGVAVGAQRLGRLVVREDEEDVRSTLIGAEGTGSQDEEADSEENDPMGHGGTRRDPTMKEGEPSRIAPTMVLERDRS